MRGILLSQNPPCPKCKSYMYFIREKERVCFRKCHNCGFKGLEKQRINWQVVKFYLKRFKFWK
jgi:hypothetical protein